MDIIEGRVIKLTITTGASITAMSITVTAQPTPNPNAMKFSVNRQLTEGSSRTYGSAAEAAGDALAAALFAVPGVKTVFILNDFVTVTKQPEAAWGDLAPAAEAALRTALAG